MTINSVKKEDRGTYYCVADNGIGKPAQRNVAVEVEFPPSVEGGGQIQQAMGYSVQMDCHVEAYPRPTITWIHQRKNLSNVRNNLLNTLGHVCGRKKGTCCSF